MLASLVLTVSIKIDYKELFEATKDFKALILGIITQIFLLPLLTFIVVSVFSLNAQLAIGLFIVGSCCGGSLSNIFTDLSNGDIKYSVLLTSFTSILGPFTIPSNILFWSSLYPPTKEILSSFNINIWEMYLNIFLTLGIPLVFGIYLRSFHKNLADQVNLHLRKVALGSMGLIIIGMSVKYWQDALISIYTILPIVFSHNILAMTLGFLIGLFLTKQKQKTLVYEVGVQNSGLGAALVFQFFPELRVALIVCFWWSIVHVLNSYLFLKMTQKMKYFKQSH